MASIAHVRSFLVFGRMACESEFLLSISQLSSPVKKVAERTGLTEEATKDICGILPFLQTLGFDVL